MAKSGVAEAGCFVKQYSKSRWFWPPKKVKFTNTGGACIQNQVVLAKDNHLILLCLHITNPGGSLRIFADSGGFGLI